MKTAFLCNSDTYYEYVYPREIIDFLCENHGCDGICYTPETLKENLEKFKDTEYIFSTWLMPTFTKEEIKKYLPSLKCVFYSAGTVQYFARPYINCGVKVFSAWAANAIPVSEYTVGQIILANKGFFKASNIKNREDYSKADKEFRKYTGNYKAKIGIIGAGMIGKKVIKLLGNYDLEVLVFDPFLSDKIAEKLGVKKVSLEALFSECNVISNHLANNAETKNMLNGNLFKMMKPYSTFLNTGRGAQVVEEDLAEVLSNRPDITAILDVTSPEPPIINSPLYKLDNCILTSHIAGSMGNEVNRMAEFMLDEFKYYLNGEKNKYEVTEAMLDTMA